jgi:hypothetical protein
VDDFDYDGEDLKLFDPHSKWFKWQNQLYSMIYNEDCTLNEPDDRTI